MISFVFDISLFRETTEDPDSQGDASSQPDTISIASRTSQNTVDSDKVGPKPSLVSNIIWDSFKSSAIYTKKEGFFKKQMKNEPL